MSTDDRTDTRLERLAERLDCFSDRDMILLTGWSPETLKASRKRGQGPTYIRAGNNVLYPRAAVAEWLEDRKRERKVAPAKELL